VYESGRKDSTIRPMGEIMKGNNVHDRDESQWYEKVSHKCVRKEEGICKTRCDSENESGRYARKERMLVIHKWWVDA